MKNEQLTWKEIIPYIPYGLEVNMIRPKLTGKVISINVKYDSLVIDKSSYQKHIKLSNIRPILYRPSDIIECIEYNNELFTPISRLSPYADVGKLLNICNDFGRKEYCANYNIDGLFMRFSISKDFSNTDWFVIQKLLEWKIDIFNLIDRNLADCKRKEKTWLQKQIVKS